MGFVFTWGCQEGLPWEERSPLTACRRREWKSWPGRGGEVQRVWGRRQPSVFQKLQGGQGGGVEGQGGGSVRVGKGGRLCLAGTQRHAAARRGGVQGRGSSAVISSSALPALLATDRKGAAGSWLHSARSYLSVFACLPTVFKFPLMGIYKFKKCNLIFYRFSSCIQKSGAESTESWHVLCHPPPRPHHAYSPASAPAEYLLRLMTQN